MRNIFNNKLIIVKKHKNLIKGIKTMGIEEIFVSDITYIQVGKKNFYLSLITDAYIRKIVGYHIDVNMEAKTVVKALEVAIHNKITTNQTIHHSDRGLQYCSNVYQSMLSWNNFLCSMTEGGNCYDNALAERMNRTMKEKFLYDLTITDLDLLSYIVKESVLIYGNSIRVYPVF